MRADERRFVEGFYLSNHALVRMIERDFSVEDIRATLTDPRVTRSTQGIDPVTTFTSNYRHGVTRVVRVAEDTKTIVSVFWDGGETRRGVKGCKPSEVAVDSPQPVPLRAVPRITVKKPKPLPAIPAEVNPTRFTATFDISAYKARQAQFWSSKRETG